MGETVLVTGGTGFIGRWCIAELLERGYDVRTTIRSLDKEPSVRAAVATVVDPDGRLVCLLADLTDDSGWDDAVAGCDYVLHVASPLGRGDPADPDDLIVPARDGALRVLRAATAAGVRRVVLTSAANASSPTSYAEDSVTDETLWTDPVDTSLLAHRRSKTIAELAAIVPGLGRRNRHTTAKAESVLGWRRRPVEETIVDCARSLLAHGVV